MIILLTNLNEAGISHHLVWFHYVDQRLLEGNFTDTAHVETIHILPPYTAMDRGQWSPEMAADRV